MSIYSQRKTTRAESKAERRIPVQMEVACVGRCKGRRQAEIDAWLQQCQQHKHDLPHLPRENVTKHGQSAWEGSVAMGVYG